MLTDLRSLVCRLSSPAAGRPRPRRKVFRPSIEQLEIRALVTHVIGDHIHPTLQIVIEGLDFQIPADIGLTDTRHFNPHTHDDAGVLHIGEGPVSGIDPPGASPRLTTLEDFFDVWRTTNVGTSRNNPDAFFSQDQILDRVADAHHAVRMTVNGQPNFKFEQYSPHDADQIVISYAALSNGQPTADSQSVDVPFGGERTVTLTGDDNDPDRVQPLSFRVDSLPSHGTLREATGAVVTSGTTVADANVHYTPSTGFAGADSFTFVALDGGENGTSAPANVTVNVAANSAPTADPQSVNVRANTMRNITLSGADGDPNVAQNLSFRVQTLPASGTLQDADGNAVVAGADLPGPELRYVPDPGFDGTDSFTFTVHDDGGTLAGGQDTSAAAAIDIQMVNSIDPNDILGPEGIGDENWVTPDTSLPFTIRFENYAEATAPAQEIIVHSTLDADLDWTTFQFGDIGFGETHIEVPAGARSFDTVVNVAQPDGTELDVTIVARLTDGVASWSLVALDPATGQLPDDPLAGFLPPNRTAPEGDGFLKFSVQPRGDREMGTCINVSAAITFDTNLPMETNELSYTVGR